MIKRFIFYTLPIHLINLFTFLLPNIGFTIRLRGFLMRPFFQSCGKDFKIASGVLINHPERIQIGSNVYIAHNCWINGTGGLKIGSNVQFGPMCVVVTSKHLYKDGEVHRESIKSKVEIKSGSWLASHSVITSGVTVGKGVVIGANAVVTRNIPNQCLAAGSPAKPVKFFE